MKIKPNCEKCYYSGAFYNSEQLARCDCERGTEPTVYFYDKIFREIQQCVKRSRWDEECDCEQFVPILREDDGDFELEEEIIYNTDFDCPFCGERIYCDDISKCDTKLIRCDNCDKMIAVDGGDY